MAYKICKDLSKCPLHNTHDKLNEAFYFLHTLIQVYHNSDLFRYHLNGFIQSLRNITRVLQKEHEKIPNFEKWYPKEQEYMKNNDLLKLFVNARNIVVKKGMLKSKSKVFLGMFRGRKLKLAFGVDITNPFIDSETLLNDLLKTPLGSLAGNGHSIGEQMGVQREWIAEDLGDKEIIELCYEAFKEIYQIVHRAHIILKYKLPQLLEESDKMIEEKKYIVLLQTDINPSLFKKWGR